MVDATLKEKIGCELRKGFGDPDDVIDVSDGDFADTVHLVVISRKFNGRQLLERADMIWSVLQDNLTPDEWGHITLSIGVTPASVDGATIEEIKTS